jgi:serine-type D-Ala-D-Ala carboxypeptidase/endopeptidase
VRERNTKTIFDGMTTTRLLRSAVAAMCVVSSTAVAQHVSRDSLQRIVDTRVATRRSTGLIVGVITPTGERWVTSAGSERAGKPVDAQTMFEIGSITKTFTATVLADMVNRGLVRLDEPVADLLPTGTRIPSRNGHVITLGNLSSQNSGLPRLPDNMAFADSTNPYADYTVAQMYAFLAGYQLTRDPGEKYEYSNLGVGLLGHALALKAGKPYEDLVRERVLTPLGMNSTVIALTPAARAHAADGHDADGHVVHWWDIPTLAGAGALRSNLDDMMKYLAAQLSPPDNAVGRAIALTHVPRFTVSNSLQLGLNWHIIEFQGDTMIWHNGGTAGFRTMIGWNPHTHVGAVLLGNSGQDNDDIVRHVVIGTPLVVMTPHTEITIPAEALRQYVGHYPLSPQFALDVTLDNGALYVQATGQPRFNIYAEAPDRFFLRVVDAQLEFSRDASGAVTGVTLVQNGARMFGSKSP